MRTPDHIQNTIMKINWNYGKNNNCKKKNEKKKKIMNGLYLDSSSGQNTQTPRDKNKRCYSSKVLTHQSVSYNRELLWRDTVCH